MKESENKTKKKTSILLIFLTLLAGPITLYFFYKSTNNLKTHSVIHSDEKTLDADLNCFFFSYDEFLDYLMNNFYSKENATDFINYIIKNAKKYNFQTQEIRQYFIKSNFTFALPTGINNNWLGRIYINNNGNITAFPPIVYQKEVILGEDISDFYKERLSFLSRKELIDYCVYSGMPSNIAIEFEQKLFKSQVADIFLTDYSSFPEEYKRMMTKMNFDYCIPTIDGDCWTKEIIIKKDNNFFHFLYSEFPHFTDFFNLHENIPVYLDEYSQNLTFSFYDDNWDIFQSVFFGRENPIEHRRKIFIPKENNDYVLNPFISDKLKKIMIEGNFSFSEPFASDSQTWPVIKNMLRNNDFYISTTY